MGESDRFCEEHREPLIPMVTVGDGEAFGNTCVFPVWGCPHVGCNLTVSPLHSQHILEWADLYPDPREKG